MVFVMKETPSPRCCVRVDFSPGLGEAMSYPRREPPGGFSFHVLLKTASGKPAVLLAASKPGLQIEVKSFCGGLWEVQSHGKINLSLWAGVPDDVVFERPTKGQGKGRGNTYYHPACLKK